MLQLETAGLSDVGRKRDHQEDAFLVDDAHRLYAVADGMGGHLAGEVASAIVIETLQRGVSKPNSFPKGKDSPPAPGAARLAAWIQDANQKVFEQAQNREECRGMGTTVSALYFNDSQAVLANLGDSPVYQMRAGSIELVSAIHNVAADERAQEMYGPDMLNLFSHMLTRAVGIQADARPYIRELNCRAGDSYILCSDGLSNALAPEEMRDLVRQYTPGKACEKCIDLANARGGNDNITVIVINVCEQLENR